MSDDTVIEARSLVGKMSIRAIAKKFGVDYKVMYYAVKGLSYKHLNLAHPPQQ